MPCGIHRVVSNWRLARNLCSRWKCYVGFRAGVLWLDTIFTSLESVIIYYTIFANLCQVKRGYELWVMGCLNARRI